MIHCFFYINISNTQTMNMHSNIPNVHNFNFNTWDDGCILTSENSSMIETSIKKITLNVEMMSIIQMGWNNRF
jgi:hypothetical protein